MQLALQQLRSRFAALRDAVNALRVVLTEDRPEGSNFLVDEMENAVADLAGPLEPTEPAFEAAEAKPMDRSAIRTVLSVCEDALDRLNAPSRVLESRLQGLPRQGAWAAWTDRVASEADMLADRMYEARQALGGAWREFTETSASGTAAERPPEDAFLEKIHAQTYDWYKQADAKATAILSFTGVFLVVLVGSVVLKGETTLLRHDSPRINFVLVGLVLALYLAGAFLCVLTLWSRGMGPSRVGIHFFGNIANLPADGSDYRVWVQRTLAKPGEDQQGRAQEVVILSQNTRRKHRLLNAAVVCSTVALIGTVVLGMTLALR